MSLFSSTVQHIGLTDMSFSGHFTRKSGEGRGCGKVSNSSKSFKGGGGFVGPSSAWKGCKIKQPRARESSLMVVWQTPGGWAGGIGRRGGHQ